MYCSGATLIMSIQNADDKLCVNTIRVVAAEMVRAANSGHPGAPMGLAPIGHALFSSVLKANPKNPKWNNRDRFVLSNGHACALQYTLLHLSGYDVSLDDLKSFRQLGSKCPGHPESFRTPGIEVSTGPLGQGIANAVGFAIAQSHLAAVYNKPEFPVSDHFTYAICGDGCLQVRPQNTRYLGVNFLPGDISLVFRSVMSVLMYISHC